MGDQGKYKNMGYEVNNERDMGYEGPTVIPHPLGVTIIYGIKGG